jgi:hypothetical protein
MEENGKGKVDDWKFSKCLGRSFSVRVALTRVQIRQTQPATRNNEKGRSESYQSPLRKHKALLGEALAF